MSASENGAASTPGWGNRREVSSPVYGRRALLRAALGAAGAAALAACGGVDATSTTGNTAPASSTAAPMATTTAAATGATQATTAAAASGSSARAEGVIPAPVPGVPDVYTQRPPLFQAVKGVPGRGGTVSFLNILFGPPPPSRTENMYWQELEKRLGVTLEGSFVPAGTLPEKLAALTAGNTLPDLTHVQLNLVPDQYKVIQQGGYTDLTPYLAGDALQEYPHLAAFPAEVWQNMRIGGKIYGVPKLALPVQGGLYFRQDWADKLGLPQSQTAEDFFQTMAAFTKRDPDGNETADTWGVGAQGGGFSLNFMEQMYRVPNDWRRNPDGTLTKNIETEEYNGALAFARRLWEAGLYHPDAPTMTNQQCRELFFSGKFGCWTGGVSGLPGIRTSTAAVTPTANVIALVPPGPDGGQGVTYRSGGYWAFTAIPTRTGKDKEQVKALLRILNWHAAPFGSAEWLFKNYGLEGVHHTVEPDGSPKLTEAGERQIEGFGLGGPPQVLYNPDNPEEAKLLQRNYAELARLGIGNPAETLYSPTAVAKQAQLNQQVRDRYTAIILGREPLSAVDELVREWRRRGGDEIRQEYEAALKAG
jgi:putative aldouronate transport system substrate-binding protein